MIFDAFGRLALGQVEQNFAIANGFMTGTGCTASVGSIKPAVSDSLVGVKGTSHVGTIAVTGASRSLVGVSATGDAGVILTPDNDAVTGVSGTGSAGTVSTALTVLTIPVQGASSVGIIVGQSTSQMLGGVSATGSAGIVVTTSFSNVIVGVRSTASAGKITTTVSGGGGGKKPKMGMEPVAKRPPIAPIPVKLPTYVVPNFKPKAPLPLPELARTPFERSPGIAPLDLTGMRQQIQSAQDEADIKAVLAFLDDLD